MVTIDHPLQRNVATVYEEDEYETGIIYFMQVELAIRLPPSFNLASNI
jgi:hypothetical protein